MYDEILLTMFIGSFLSSIFTIYYMFYVIKKFTIYEMKKSFHFELYVLKNITTKNMKDNIKKAYEIKKKNEKKFIVKSFIFILIINTIFLILLFIRFLLNPKKFTTTLKTILSNLKGILLLEMGIILISAVISILSLKFVMIPFNSLIIKSALTKHLFENLLFFI